MIKSMNNAKFKLDRWNPSDVWFDKDVDKIDRLDEYLISHKIFSWIQLNSLFKIKTESINI